MMEKLVNTLSKLTPLILGLLVTGAGTWYFQSKQTQLDQINALNSFRELFSSASATDRAFAYEAFVALGYEEMAIKLCRAAKDPSCRSAIGAVATVSATGSEQMAQTLLSDIPVSVYLHIGEEEDRPAAQAVGDAITTNLNYVIEDIEIESSSETTNTEIRYYSEADKVPAQQIQKELESLGFSSVVLVKLAYSKARPGSVEIWLSS